MKAIIFCLLVLTASINSRSYAQGSTTLIQQAQTQFQEGQVAEASKFYEKALAKASAEGKRQTWWALMSLAWFKNITGEFKESIELSNQALELGMKQDDHFLIGRSLCWLGGAYAGLGRYQAAVAFYEEAASLGLDDTGDIKLPHVWGLATQELGNTLFKLGKIDKAKELLEETTSYATKHGIAVGISEGGVALGEIFLSQGDLKEARVWAQKAVDASWRCNCSPFNTARALLFKAKVAQADQSLQLVAEALAYARKFSVKPIMAEALLFRSRILPKDKIEERRSDIEEALRLVGTLELESRALAQSAAASYFLDQKSTELAEFYSKNGLKMSAEMLRSVELAYLLSEKAAISSANGKTDESLSELVLAAKKAQELKQIPLAIENQEKLSDAYLMLGYDYLSLVSAQAALKNVEEFLVKKQLEEVTKGYEYKKLKLLERVASLSLKIGSIPEKPE